MAFAYFFALMTGLVSAGFVATLWPLIGGRPVSWSILQSTTLLLPLELIVVVFSTPFLLAKAGARLYSSGKFRGVALGAYGGSLLSGFLQGVALLSILYRM